MISITAPQLRGRPVAALCLLAMLWLASAAVSAQPSGAEAPADTPLTLDSDVALPEGLWPPAKIVMPAPSVAVAPPEPLTPPPVKTLTIMLDWFLSPQHAPLLLAKVQGFYQKEGLDVTLRPPADPSLPAKLLAAGEVDAALARQPLLHLRNHDGSRLVRIATLMETPLNAVIVAGDAASKELDALATRTYGYATQEGAELIVPLLVPDSVRQTDGYTAPRNVHYSGERELRQGNIDIMVDGFDHALPTRLATDGIATRVIPYTELGLPVHDGLILMINGDTLNERKLTWQHLTAALGRATRWIAQNPKRAWQTLIEAYPVLDNSANEAAWPALVRRMALRPAAVDSRRYRRLEAFLQDRGITDARLPTSTLAADPHAL
ncbi:hypothetical protein GCM10022228_19440 [Halomonas cibimaris]|uniref:SsuA/THI5-like domain-containing protein n=1 Tax=Halomonas cibimaris TaxID=657012 RepID=A0ABP7LYW1_9GAMM